jgi:hypothetical protein
MEFAQPCLAPREPKPATFNCDLTTARLTSVTNPENGTVTLAKGQKVQFTNLPITRFAVEGGAVR